MTRFILKFLATIICGFIPSRALRHRIRIFMNNPSIRTYVRFVRDWADENCGGVQSLRMSFGVGGKNLVVLLNRAHVFKFPLDTVNKTIVTNELKICDALRPISPIYIPELEIINWHGILVRRYEYVAGKLLCDFSVSQIMQNREKLATQLANFMNVIGRANPMSLRDLKPSPNARAGYMYGWFQNDIGQNFLMDDEFNIVGFIDWEGAAFCDWRPTLRMAERFWNKNGYRGLMTDVLSEYSRLYYMDKPAAKK